LGEAAKDPVGGETSRRFSKRAIDSRRFCRSNRITMNQMGLNNTMGCWWRLGG
jgi:hypothetical protein